MLLSGGVDSSLALHLLKAAGHHVTAFYLQVQIGGIPACGAVMLVGLLVLCWCWCCCHMSD